MADQQHLERLKQNVVTWNQWRQESQVRPDFVGADLSWLDLSGADLSGADLSWANLQHAVFVQVNLGGALLREANLSEADFSSVNLRQANLTAADLGTVNFTGVQLFDTVLADVDLSLARGLDTCQHFGPSIVDHRTLERSKNPSPRFLRGCGLSEPLIAFAANLSDTPPPPNCFISYATADQAFVDRLYRDLQIMGIRCWLSAEEADSGLKWRVGIDQPLRRRERLLIVLSESSLDSSAIEQEVEAMFLREGEQKQAIIHALRIDNGMSQTAAGWPAQLYASRSIIDFRGWNEKSTSYADGLEKLICQLVEPE